MRSPSRYLDHVSTMPGSGEKNGLLSTSSQVQRARSILCGPTCTSAPRMRHARDDLARDRTGRHPHRRLARAGAPAAAIVADAVLGPVGVVGVAGAELVLDVGIILTALVDVVDDQRDRRAGRHLPAASSVNTPETIRTVSGSRRWVVKRDWPGLRLSRKAWISPSDNGIPGGQPSTTQPIAAPWLSPQVVTRKQMPECVVRHGTAISLFAVQPMQRSYSSCERAAQMQRARRGCRLAFAR